MFHTKLQSTQHTQREYQDVVTFVRVGAISSTSEPTNGFESGEQLLKWASTRSNMISLLGLTLSAQLECTRRPTPLQNCIFFLYDALMQHRQHEIRMMAYPFVVATHRV